MGLETGSKIEDLNSGWPLGSDGMNDSDNHHRLIKTCVQGSFPNLGANAYTGSATDLNNLVAESEADSTEVNIGFMFNTGYLTITLVDISVTLIIRGGPAGSLVSWTSTATGADNFFASGKLKLDENGNGNWTSKGGNIAGTETDGTIFTQVVQVHDDDGGRDTSGSPLTTGYYYYLTQSTIAGGS